MRQLEPQCTWYKIYDALVSFLFELPLDVNLRTTYFTMKWVYTEYTEYIQNKLLFSVYVDYWIFQENNDTEVRGNMYRVTYENIYF